VFARELAAAKELRSDVDFDDELLFLSCILHDLGAIGYGNGDQRFEVDGADAAARFLREYGVAEDRVNTVWQAIALHTTIGIAHRFGPEQAIAQLGISADMNFERIVDGLHARRELREIVVTEIGLATPAATIKLSNTVSQRSGNVVMFGSRPAARCKRYL
jgi:HD superfamily phosphodiesterase